MKNKKEDNAVTVRYHITKAQARKLSALKCRQFGKDHEGAFRGRVMWGGVQGNCVRGRGGRGEFQGKFIRGREGNGGGKKICRVRKGRKTPAFSGEEIMESLGSTEE